MTEFTEISVLRHLSDARDSLLLAKKLTRLGLLDDNCQNALAIVHNCMAMAVSDTAERLEEATNDDKN